jgi:hypothetical protein
VLGGFLRECRLIGWNYLSKCDVKLARSKLAGVVSRQANGDIDAAAAATSPKKKSVKVVEY